eukprot:15451104-Alexandrium_andersonii.AAC.1
MAEWPQTYFGARARRLSAVLSSARRHSAVFAVSRWFPAMFRHHEWFNINGARRAECSFRLPRDCFKRC